MIVVRQVLLVLLLGPFFLAMTIFGLVFMAPIMLLLDLLVYGRPRVRLTLEYVLSPPNELVEMLKEMKA